MNRAERRRAEREQQAASVRRPQPLPLVTVPVQRPATATERSIPLWSKDAAGRLIARRDAEFWHPLSDQRVACDLCYRRCDLADGEAGWCDIRKNQGGKLVLTEHGVLTNAQAQVTHYPFWRQHARMAWFGGVRCTAGCSFCTSTRIVHQPEALAWTPPGERRLSSATGGWAYYRGMLHPQGAIAAARGWGCSGVYFGANEPTLTYEWTLDVARLAKEAGLYVSLDTNGFTTPEAIRRLSPFVDMAYLGIKGHAAPEFYADHMRSPGAVPNVLEAARTWQDAGVKVNVSDVVPPPHWMEADAAEGHARRLYEWIAREMGRMTPLEMRGMVKPQFPYGDEFLPLLPGNDGYRSPLLVEFLARSHRAEEIARESGLLYVYSDEYRTVRCHRCDGVLLARVGSPDYELHVTDGHCDHCAEAVPVVALSRAEYAAIQQEAKAG